MERTLEHGKRLATFGIPLGPGRGLLCGLGEIANLATDGASLLLQLPLATPSPAQTHPKPAGSRVGLGRLRAPAAPQVLLSSAILSTQDASGRLAPKISHYNGFSWRPGSSVAKAGFLEPRDQGLPVTWLQRAKSPVLPGSVGVAGVQAVGRWLLGAFSALAHQLWDAGSGWGPMTPAQKTWNLTASCPRT